MPFCEQCKALVYPKEGKMNCRRCGWTSDANAKSKVLEAKAASTERVVLEQKLEARPQQDTECPKCGHQKAYFHLMQTRKSDEPPTEINECVKCSHSWREY